MKILLRDQSAQGVLRTGKRIGVNPMSPAPGNPHETPIGNAPHCADLDAGLVVDRQIALVAAWRNGALADHRLLAQ